MKSVWRRECTKPCNVFFIDAQQSEALCIQALDKLILSAVVATPLEKFEYSSFAPKPSAIRKRVLDTAKKVSSNFRSLDNLRDQVVRSVLQDTQAVQISPPPKLSERPVTTTVVIPSPLRPISSSAVTSLQLSPIPSTTTAFQVYEKLVTCLLKMGQSYSVVLPLEPFRESIQHSVVEYPMLRYSTAVDQRGRLFGVPDSMQLLIKAVLVEWLRTLCHMDMTQKTANVHVGFYVSPDPSWFYNLYVNAVLPANIAQNNHRIELSYAAAVARCKPNVKPILIAFFQEDGDIMVQPAASWVTVKGCHLLPIGVSVGY